MNKIKVSVIVPVYNTEKYLRKCLESVLFQTLKEIEIILINDGSKDNSHLICEEYRKRDKRIIYVNKKNEGCSATRNIGISMAKGEYIAFVDSDDFIEKDMYKIMYDKAKEDNLDILICGIKLLDENYKFLRGITPKKQSKLIDYQKSGEGNCFNSQSNKLYKKSFILKNNIFFPISTHMGEDLFFNIKAFYFTKKIDIIEGLYYNYYNNLSSVTHNLNKKFEIFITLHEIFNFFKEVEREKYIDIFNEFLIYSGISCMYGTIEDLRIQKDKNWKEVLRLSEKNIRQFENNFTFKQKIYIFYRKQRIKFYFLKPVVKKIRECSRKIRGIK